MVKKSDHNQKQIVEALRKMGAFVFSLHTLGRGCPDLLIAFRGHWFVGEVKNGSLMGWKRTQPQKDFIEACKAPIALFTCVEDVVTWANAVTRGAKGKAYHEVPF